MNNKNSFKILALTVILIFLKWSGVFFSEEIEYSRFEYLFNILTSISMIYGYYLVMKMESIVGIFMWLAAEIIPRIYLLTISLDYAIQNQMSSTMFLILVSIAYFLILFSMIACRLFMQWTNQIWQKYFNINIRYWKALIYFESSIFIVLAGILSAMIEINNSSIIIILGSVVSGVYSKFMFKRYLPLLASGYATQAS